MKKILALCVLLVLAASAASAQQAKPEAHGYFAFSFIRGGEEGGPSGGSLEGLGGGLLLTGIFTSRIDYRLEVRSRSVADFALEEAWLGIGWAETLILRAGLFLVPFGRHNLFSRPHENMFIQTPLTVARAYPDGWRDLGLLASGKVSFVVYAVSLGNGLGEDDEGGPVQQFRDNNASKDVAGRLGIRWRPGMETAVSYSRQNFSTDGSRRADFLGADASWITEDFRVAAEYVRVDRDDPAGGRGIEEGWHIQLAMDYKTVWPTASYQSLKTAPAGGDALRTNRWTLGLAWAVFPGAWLKTEYAWNREPGAETANDLVSMQLAVSF